MFNNKMSFVGLILILFILRGNIAGDVRGVVRLDEITFDKIVDSTRNVLVKFDEYYPAGDIQEMVLIYLYIIYIFCYVALLDCI